MPRPFRGMPAGCAADVAAGLDGAPLGALVLPDGRRFLFRAFLLAFGGFVDLGLVQRAVGGRQPAVSPRLGRRLLRLFLLVLARLAPASSRAPASRAAPPPGAPSARPGASVPARAIRVAGRPLPTAWRAGGLLFLDHRRRRFRRRFRRGIALDEHALLLDFDLDGARLAGGIRFLDLGGLLARQRDLALGLVAPCTLRRYSSSLVLSCSLSVSSACCLCTPRPSTARAAPTAALSARRRIV